MAHTDGPWHLYVDEDGNTVSVTYKVTAGRRASIAKMPVPGPYCELSWPSINANARLIAAAPDLLETAIALLPHVHTGPRDFKRDIAHWESERQQGNGQAPVVLAAYAAIAKATDTP